MCLEKCDILISENTTTQNRTFIIYYRTELLTRLVYVIRTTLSNLVSRVSSYGE